MQDIVYTLQSFSDEKDLWTLAKNRASKYLDEYLDAHRSDTLFSFKGLTSKNFVFSDQSQSLVFHQHSAPTFLIRTTLSIARDNNSNQFLGGEYSLDVDSGGEIQDESLYFF